MLFAVPAAAEGLRDLDRERARAILRNVQKELQKHYYDAEFNGVDLEARFQAAEASLDKATTLGQAFGAIALAVLDLEDSHTFFFPPTRTVDVEYGWRMQAIDEGCYVTVVKPGSDAEAKGLRAGDRVLAVDGYPLTRQNLRLFFYRYYVLQPQASLRLLVEDAQGRQRELVIDGEVKNRKRLIDLADDDIDFWNLVRAAQGDRLEDRFATLDGDGGKRILWWSMPAFRGERATVRRLIAKARKHDALILDLRGNGGGRVVRLLEVVSLLFGRDVQVARTRGRHDYDPLVAEGMPDKAFNGKLVVLVDSESASASEILARVVQREGRGVVVGDRTAGAVMMSRTYSHQLGRQRIIPYAIQITRADLLLGDGERLEKTGVVPDEVVLPTSADLAAGRDPALARAAAILGRKIDPAQAGELTRYEWED